jgi:hypothetical protein
VSGFPQSRSLRTQSHMCISMCNPRSLLESFRRDASDRSYPPNWPGETCRRPQNRYYRDRRGQNSRIAGEGIPITILTQKRDIIEGALAEDASKAIARLSAKDLLFLFGIGG